MAYVMLEDDTATMELLCFSRTLNESGSFIRENSAILATGKISVRDDKEPQLMVDAIRPLSDLGEAAGGGQTLYLRLSNREDPRMRKVRLALSFFRRARWCSTLRTVRSGWAPAVRSIPPWSRI